MSQKLSIDVDKVKTLLNCKEQRRPIMNLSSNVSNTAMYVNMKQEVLVSRSIGSLLTLTVLSASFSFFLEFLISSLLSSSSSVPTTSQKTTGPEGVHGIVQFGNGVHDVKMRHEPIYSI